MAGSDKQGSTPVHYSSLRPSLKQPALKLDHTNKNDRCILCQTTPTLDFVCSHLHGWMLLTHCFKNGRLWMNTATVAWP
eukprot:2969325-Amphidinium_carterae.1